MSMLTDGVSACTDHVEKSLLYFRRGGWSITLLAHTLYKLYWLQMLLFIH